MFEQILREHKEIRSIVRKADSEKLVHFAQLLSDIIRFKERELFEVAQRQLSAEQLTAISDHGKQST